MAPSSPKPSLASRLADLICPILLGVAFAVIQILIGGTRLLFSLPAYALIGVMSLAALPLLRRARPAPDRLCLAATAIFFGYILGRAALSPVAYLARSDVYSVLGGLLVYGFTAWFMTAAKPRMLFLLFLLALGTAHVVVGVIQYRDGSNFMPISWLQRFDYGRRASGLYVCPNHLAGLLEVLGLFGLSLVCWSRWPVWSKLLIGYVVCVCFAGLVLTGSRGGYVSTVASLAAFGLLSLAVLRKAGSGLFWKLGGAGAVVAGIMVLSVVLFLRGSDYLAARANNVFETDNMRVDLWAAAIEQWKVNPLVGTGSGTYLFYGREFRTVRMQLDPIYVHNDYLHLLGEYGAIGAAALILFLVAHALRGWKSFQRLGPRRVMVAPRLSSNGLALNLGALCAVIACAVHSVVDFNLHIPANLLLLAFVFGILANPGVHWDEKRPAPSGGAIACRLIAPALAVFVIVQAIRLLPGEYFAERARIALRNQDPGEAILYARDGLHHESANPDLYYYLGTARSLLGETMRDERAAVSFYTAALPAFEAARALAPRDETYLLELGFTYDALGEFQNAEEMYQAALVLDPKSTSARRYYEGHLKRWQSKSSGSQSAPASDPRTS